MTKDVYSRIRSNRIQKIFKKFNIEHILDHVLLFNESNNLPYHGIQHSLTVALNSYEGATYYNLGLDETKDLLIAALLHDTNMTLGAGEDNNIAQARKFAEVFTENNNNIQNLIQATYYPHSKARTLSEKIIQDSDLMQMLEPDYEFFIKGLELEGITCDPKFPHENNLNTQWAKDKYTKTMNERFN